MSYKYQKDILSTLIEDVERHIEDKNYIRKGQQGLADIHRCDTKRMSSELNEVYRKAKAFDKLLEAHDYYLSESQNTERARNLGTWIIGLVAIYRVIESEAE